MYRERKHELLTMRFSDGGAQPEGMTQEQTQESTTPPAKENLFSQEDVNKFLAKERKSLESDFQKRMQAKIDEAQRLQEMDAQQKADYEHEKLTKELDALKAEKVERTLRDEAIRMAAEKKIDPRLVDFIPFKGATAEQVNEQLATLDAAFKSAVEDAVQNTLRGAGTPSGQGTQANAMSGVEAEFYKLNPKLKH